MRPASRAAQPLGRQQLGAQRQQGKPRLAAAFFKPQRVGNFGSKHLQAPTYAHHGPAPLVQALTSKSAYTGGQPATLQKTQVVHSVAASRQNHRMRRTPVLCVAHNAQPHTGLVAQGIEIGGIAQVRQVGNHNIQQPCSAFWRIFCPGPVRARMQTGRQPLLEAHGIFFRKPQIFQHGHNAPKRLARAALQQAQGRIKQAGITPELVENKPAHPAALCAGQQGHGSRKGRKRAAPVNIGHQRHQRPRMAGHAHVYNVVRPEVDFCRAARTFNHHHVHVCGQAAVGTAHGLPRRWLVGEIFAYAHLPHRLAQHNHL